MKYLQKTLTLSLSAMLTCAALSASDKKVPVEATVEAATEVAAPTVGGMPLTINVDVPVEQTGGQKVKLIHVAMLSDVEGNNEFKRNVSIMQRHQENIQALQRTVQTVEDEELKASLEEELQSAVDRLNSDNKKMVDAYGFSLTRRYEQVVEKSHIYMYVTEEEAEEFLKQVDQAGKAVDAAEAEDSAGAE